MGAHHYDIAKWAMDIDETGPVKIIPPKEGSSGLKMIYADGLEIIHESTKDAFNDVVFYGDEGTLYVDRSGITANPKSAVDSPSAARTGACRTSAAAIAATGSTASAAQTPRGRCLLRAHWHPLQPRQPRLPTSPRPPVGRQEIPVPRRSRCQRPHRPPRPRRVEIGLMKLT